MTQTAHQGAAAFTEVELRELFEDSFGRWQVVLTQVQRRWIKRAGFTGQRVHGFVLLDGMRVGTLCWRLNDDLRSANLTEITLDEGARGNGFASQWFERSRARLRRAGIERIDVDAIDDGRIVWARMGFQVDQDEWQRLLYRAARLKNVDSGAVERLCPERPQLLALADVAAGSGNVLSRLDWTGSLAA